MTKNFTRTNYQLQSVRTGMMFHNNGWTLEAPDEKECTLIRAVYEKKQLEVKDDSWGLYRYADWLPVSRKLIGSSAPVTYKSTQLAKQTGLKNLWITFSGYWPERNAAMTTCSFKETEAYAVCGRMTPEMNKVLVVASAGNTARAFAKVCSDNQIPLLLSVPEDNLDALWFEKPLNQCVKLICSRSGSDYSDAIYLSDIVAAMDGFIPEGGAKNIARRDGMATTVLSAVSETGKIPDYYFQAVGSGTGAIAAWEANLRLIADGRYGTNKMKLMVSQNAPFLPIFNAWKAGSRNMLPFDENMARRQVEKIVAKVLSNRKPPYPIPGGLFDALTDTDGDVFSVTNEQALAAARLFEETEGIDIHPAAAVATASLIEATNTERINKEALIILNITGGGEKRFKEGKELFYLKPNIVFDIEVSQAEIRDKVKKLF